MDIKDSVFLNLIESVDTSYTSTVYFDQFLWVEIPMGFQEDSTWLNKTIWDKAAMGIANPKIGRNLSFDKIGDCATITLYSLSGRKIAALKQNGPTDSHRYELFGKLHPGVYVMSFGFSEEP